MRLSMVFSMWLWHHDGTKSPSVGGGVAQSSRSRKTAASLKGDLQRLGVGECAAQNAVVFTLLWSPLFC